MRTLLHLTAALFVASLIALAATFYASAARGADQNAARAALSGSINYR